MNQGCKRTSEPINGHVIDLVFDEAEEGDVFEIVLTDYVAVVCFLHVSDPREITCVIVDWKTGEMRHEVRACKGSDKGSILPDPLWIAYVSVVPIKEPRVCFGLESSYYHTCH